MSFILIACISVSHGSGMGTPPTSQNKDFIPEKKGLKDLSDEFVR